MDKKCSEYERTKRGGGTFFKIVDPPEPNISNCANFKRVNNHDEDPLDGQFKYGYLHGGADNLTQHHATDPGDQTW